MAAEVQAQHPEAVDEVGDDPVPGAPAHRDPVHHEQRRRNGRRRRSPRAASPDRCRCPRPPRRRPTARPEASLDAWAKLHPCDSASSSSSPSPRRTTAPQAQAVYQSAARAGGPRRRAGLRLGVGGRAPLPRGLQPLLGAGAVPHRRHAARTGTDPRRSCTGRWCACPEMNHPVRVAERAAALDILSDGRLDVGTARSSTWTELGGFDVDPDMTKQTWDEYVHVLPKMWSGEPFSHEGLGWRMPERRVLPTPVQDPHPPLCGHPSPRRAPSSTCRRPRHRLSRRGRGVVRRAGAAHGRIPPTGSSCARRSAG